MKRATSSLMLTVWVAGITGLSGSALADLAPPTCNETAGLLPARIFQPRLMQVYSDIDGKFNDSGHVEALGAPLNKPVRMSDVIGASGNAQSTRDYITNVLHLSPDASLGDATGQVNTSVDVKVPMLAYGVTSRWNVGVIVPIYRIDVNAQTGFRANDNARAFVNGMASNEASRADAIRRLNDPIAAQLEAYGYQPIRSETVSGLGDVQLASKYLLRQEGPSTLSIKNTLYLPTGIAANADKLVDAPTGDGRFAVANLLTHDYLLPGEDFVWNVSGTATLLAPNRMVKRVPVSSDSPLSPDKEELTRKPGAQFQAQTALTYYAPFGLSAGVGLASAYRTAEGYSSGSLYSPERYALLDAQKPSETLHTGILSMGYTTTGLYQQKKFDYPFSVIFAYSRPYAGRNVNKDGLVTGELQLFF